MTVTPRQPGARRPAGATGEPANGPGPPQRLDFGTSGVVVIATGKVEYGQGVWTALTQIAAEELDVRLDRVRVAPVSTDASPDEGVTSGSVSIEDAGAALRQASARARHDLLAGAAARLGTSPAGLSVRDGEVTAPSGGTGLTYWSPSAPGPPEAPGPPKAPDPSEAPGPPKAPDPSEAPGPPKAPGPPGAAGAPDVPGQPAMTGPPGPSGPAGHPGAPGSAVGPKPPGQWSVAGCSAPRLDLPDKVTGRPRFLHDLVLPGMLYGRVVRPPAPAAELQYAGQPALPAGVVDVVTDGSFLGVVAETDAVASAAARLLGRAARWEVRESLPGEDDLRGFLLGAPAETSVIARRRDQAAGARVSGTLAAEYTRPYIAHASIAPSCAIARAEGTTVTVWTHSQGIFALRRALAAGLGLPPEGVIVRYAEGAGAYGHNGADDAALDAVLLARSPACRGRPVRVIWSRADELSWAPLGPAMLARLSAGLGPDGRILTWRHDVWSNGFLGRPGTGGEPRLLALAHLAGGQPITPAQDGPPTAVMGAARNSVPGYDIPDLEVRRHRLLTMPVRTSALRSLGAFLNVFAIESFMDELAAAAGGAGEVAQGPVAGAVGNAVANAAGVRVRDLPLTREQVIRAIEQS